MSNKPEGVIAIHVVCAVCRKLVDHIDAKLDSAGGGIHVTVCCHGQTETRPFNGRAIIDSLGECLLGVAFDNGTLPPQEAQKVLEDHRSQGDLW